MAIKHDIVISPNKSDGAHDTYNPHTPHTECHEFGHQNTTGNQLIHFVVI